MALTYSKIARIITSGVRDPKLATVRAPWGFLIHTTGGGVTDKANREARAPIAVALQVYLASQNGANGYMWGGPTYVGDHDGDLIQIAPDEAFTNHCGGPHRLAYLNGSWPTTKSGAGKVLSAKAVSEWREKWPKFKSPYHLFPSTSPNANYVGLELIPIGDGFGGAPMRPGLRFTKAQHDTAIALGKELGARFGWPVGWASSNRLVGHEDVDPIERSDALGGWDPGWNRDAPYFDMAYVRAGIVG